MKIKKITFPTELVEVNDITNDNIDVFVELEDGNTYTMVVITPKNILQLMEFDNKDYFVAGSPMIIVKELTYDSVYSALRSFCEDEAYWLKEYYLSGSFSIGLLNKMVKDLQED